MASDPYLDAGIRGHIVRVARENVHRVAGCDTEDLIQEGYLCFAIVHKRYVGRRPKQKADGSFHRGLPLKPDGVARRHFMRLFQRTFHNRLATLAKRQSAFQELLLNDLIREDVSEQSAWDKLIPPEDEVSTVTDLLRAAPREIKMLFALMIDDVVRPYREIGSWRRGLVRETNKQYYGRLLGIYGVDLESLVENYFLT